MQQQVEPYNNRKNKGDDVVMVDSKVVDSYRNPEHFMEIVDADLFSTVLDMSQKGGLQTINSALRLRVIKSSGVQVKQDFKISSTDLNTNHVNTKYKHFYNNGNGGITFKVEVIIKDKERWGYGVETNADYIADGKTYPKSMEVSSWIHYWYVNMRPVYVVTDAIDVADDIYLITDCSSRKQKYTNYTIWTLEFERYFPLTVHKWSVAPSISKMLNKKTTTTASSTNTSLKNCADNMEYSKTEKVTDCNKILQTKLYELGFLREDQIDGWYGNITMNAVKQFQKYHNSKGGSLLVDGIAGPVTVGIMCKY